MTNRFIAGAVALTLAVGCGTSGDGGGGERSQCSGGMPEQTAPQTDGSYELASPTAECERPGLTVAAARANVPTGTLTYDVTYANGGTSVARLEIEASEGTGTCSPGRSGGTENGMALGPVPTIVSVSTQARLRTDDGSFDLVFTLSTAIAAHGNGAVYGRGASGSVRSEEVGGTWRPSLTEYPLHKLVWGDNAPTDSDFVGSALESVVLSEVNYMYDEDCSYSQVGAEVAVLEKR